MAKHSSPTDPPVDALQAPWRNAYLQSLASDEGKKSGAPAPDEAPGCFLAEYWAHPEQDEANHVIARVGAGEEAGMILLNRYPYANGHLLVALGDGRPRLLDYSEGQRAALWRLVDLATDLIERGLEPQGVNIGINQGRAAGAGVPGHLHVHLVPRWNGDVNFITVVGRVRVNPSALEDVAKRYREVWAQMRALGRAAQ
ncbi:MAG: HIT domain-containing protein [Planctomycetota bacterium]|nr:HIT domain-containing protein [Planctomycetota bacterium]